jgi:hypothetical protein
MADAPSARHGDAVLLWIAVYWLCYWPWASDPTFLAGVGRR